MSPLPEVQVASWILHGRFDDTQKSHFPIALSMLPVVPFIRDTR